MLKNFQIWHKKKTFIHERQPRVFFQQREIWFCHLGENVGFEQDGRGDEFLRPIVIVKKFNNEICFVVPLTRKKKEAQLYYFVFSFDARGKSTAILSQLRLIDAKRLKYKIGNIREDDFVLLKQKNRHFFV